MKDQRALVRSLRILWASIDSHLDECIAPTEKKKCCRAAVGSRDFHRKTVKEYGEMLKTLTDLL